MSECEFLCCASGDKCDNPVTVWATIDTLKFCRLEDYNRWCDNHCLCYQPNLKQFVDTCDDHIKQDGMHIHPNQVAASIIARAAEHLADYPKAEWKSVKYASKTLIFTYNSTGGTAYIPLDVNPHADRNEWSREEIDEILKEIH